MRWKSLKRSLHSLKEDGTRSAQLRYVLVLCFMFFTGFQSVYSQGAIKMTMTSKQQPQLIPYTLNLEAWKPTLTPLRSEPALLNVERKNLESALNLYDQLIEDCLTELETKDSIIDDYESKLTEAIELNRKSLEVIDDQNKRISRLIVTRNICIGISVGTVLTMLVLSCVNNY